MFTIRVLQNTLLNNIFSLLGSNGLNPVWNFTCTFEVHCPELALLRFQVEDGDFLGGGKSDPFIGQAGFPVDSIRCGKFL